ncbi:DUF262 domain-containing protein [Porphyromonas somerae]|uniref:Uncharacterized protein n=1 Tax=Porphyromonas somerae TaxID=322095 RepID=A0A134B685_9PORP|nr:DUF262 domain-containing protein [Porphyromonas somerae]KXB74017.1 hypothetical protein HMPREF3184_01369 [Porphyromonadaceae bacterium KA00676]KXB75445.1 hypothetical protein HMPREF3185_01369 [Porphyromonas somerae]
MSEARILSVEELLKLNLVIPSYQRPYKWTEKNIRELILDIQKGIEDAKKYPNFKYRVGTVILYQENDTKPYEIVDGQQRILSFLLLKLCLSPNFTCSLLSATFSDKVTLGNLHSNSDRIREWCSSVDVGVKEAFDKALSEVLEVVVLMVNELSEAFQLFDSQNTRGRELYPHDLLKAYHLREIHDKYDMQRAVLKWESKDPKAIRELFDNYLFPLWNWSKRRKSSRFTAAEIDLYKGIEESSGYTYARRANKAMPYFLLSEPLISGGDFFEMVDHYMQMLHSIKLELIDNPDFARIKELLIDDKSKVGQIKTPADLDKACKSSSTGMNHARNLFFCALLCYYDRFHNFDLMAVKKLFTWAMMLRVDMNHLGFDSVNRYAIGLGDNDKYTNSEPVISLISSARRHTEISGMPLIVKRDNDEAEAEKWQGLYEDLLLLNGYK